MDNETVYFLIQPTTHGTYELEDCGTGGGFQNCNTEDMAQALFTSAFGAGLAEAIYACVSQIMGGGSIGPTLFGNSSWGMVGDGDRGWVLKNWSVHAEGCSSNYKLSISGDEVQTSDTRNTN
jgi:hypothetical protein